MQVLGMGRRAIQYNIFQTKEQVWSKKWMFRGRSQFTCSFRAYPDPLDSDMYCISLCLDCKQDVNKSKWVCKAVKFRSVDGLILCWFAYYINSGISVVCTMTQCPIGCISCNSNCIFVFILYTAYVLYGVENSYNCVHIILKYIHYLKHIKK
jgi:hypothetical protein